MIEMYKELANAIVLQAVKDWRSAVRTLKKRPWYDQAKRTRNECERFFRSIWFVELTGLDGRVILKKLKQEEKDYDQ